MFRRLMRVIAAACLAALSLPAPAPASGPEIVASRASRCDLKAANFDRQLAQKKHTLAHVEAMSCSLLEEMPTKSCSRVGRGRDRRRECTTTLVRSDRVSASCEKYRARRVEQISKNIAFLEARVSENAGGCDLSADEREGVRSIHGTLKFSGEG